MCLIVTRPQRQSVESTYIPTKAIIYSSIEQTLMARPFCHVKVLIITFGISPPVRSYSELFKIAWHVINIWFRRGRLAKRVKWFYLIVLCHTDCGRNRGKFLLLLRYISNKYYTCWCTNIESLENLVIFIWFIGWKDWVSYFAAHTHTQQMECGVEGNFCHR